MNLEIYIPFSEKVEYLRKHDYKIGKRKETMSWSVYHNDVETEEVEVWYVQKDGKDFQKPSLRDFGSEEWVNDVFRWEIHNKLKTFILSL